MRDQGHAARVRAKLGYTVSNRSVLVPLSSQNLTLDPIVYTKDESEVILILIASTFLNLMHCDQLLDCAAELLYCMIVLPNTLGQ